MKILVSSIIVLCLFCVSPVSAELIEYLTFDVDGTATVGFDTVLGTAASIDTLNTKVGVGCLALSGAPVTETNGSDGAVTSSSFDWSASDVRTVSFWMKATSGDKGDSNATMISLGSGGGAGNRFDIRLATDALRFEIQSAGYTTTSIVADSTWHHIVVVIPNASSTVSDAMYYIDGSYVGNFVSSTALVTGVGPLRIGDSYWDSGRDYKGLIDDVQLYDDALTGGDIAYLYNNPGNAIGLVPRVTLVVPADGSDPVSVNPTLEWVGPDDTNVDSYDVYLGTDADVVNNPKVIDGELVTSYSPATLAYGTTYYWCVDIHDGASLYQGKTWSFTTTGKAFDPDPADGAISVEPAGNVTWLVDPLVASCDVYFGTYSNLTFVGNYSDNYISKADLAQAVSLSMLESAASYNWRVDTRDSDGNLLVEGDVWSFTVKVYTQSYGIVVEDFDSYADNSELFVNWADGAANGSGSTVQIEPLTNILQFSYDNTSSPYDSMVGRTYSIPQDWTENGSASIEINYRAADGNDPAQMYLVLNDGTMAMKVINPVADATGDVEWRSWRVSLADFAEAGVNCENVVYFEIGCGDGAAGGAGVMYLNDIVLKRPACLDEYMSAADLDGDCDVDSADLILLAAQWLRSDYSVVAQQPSTVSLRAYYAFEEMAGYDVLDSSGNGYTAQIIADDLIGVWDNSGVSGSCVDIAEAEIEIPADVFNLIGESFTMAFWVNGDPAEWPTNADTIEFSVGAIPVVSNDRDRLYWQIDSADSYGGQWNHYALVKDTPTGMLKIYHNGVLVAQNLDANESIAANNWGVMLLETLNQSSQFKVDEFYVYDTALTQSEIVYLLSGATSEVIQPISPVLTNADILADGSVDMADLAIFAQNWLATQIWP